VTGVLRIQEKHVTSASLAEYASVPIAFTVTSVFDVHVIENGLGGWRLEERAVTSYVKDYDALEPPTWATRWDTTEWGLLGLLVDDRRVGGAIVAVRTPGLWLLEGRDDMSLLLDIRIEPRLRRRGLGQHIFEAACAWAKQKNCRWLKIETQNTNVPSCRFYARQGCTLRTIHPGAYTELPEEIQLLWYRGM
jgi:GNAT superfamily N-acetyltransferase